MTVHHGDIYSKDDCESTHKSISRKFGFILTALSVICIFIGWNTYASNCAKNRADDAVTNSSLIEVKTGEFRSYIKQDMLDMKQSMRSLGEKQDRMNESLQRLIQKTDSK